MTKKPTDTLTKGSALTLIRGLLHRSMWEDPLYAAHRELETAAEAEKKRLIESSHGLRYRTLKKQRDKAYAKCNDMERKNKTLLLSLMDSFMIDGVTKTNKLKLRRILKAMR